MSDIAFEDDQRFEILDKLAEGGMGVVFRARHVGLDKLVALKVLNASCNDETAIMRFQNEAKTLSRLSHRSIAEVYDFGISKAGEPFMAIEFIEGVTMQGLLEERRRLPLEEALPLFIDISEALGHAHQRGVVHRDIKPSNVIIQNNEDGSSLAKLVDFGIAKDSFSDTGELTRTGGLIGSPLYMSPEQTMGQTITPQSDMYSLGCVIYHCLIGKPPFAGETIFDTITKHREAKIPSMSKRRPEIPARLDELVTRLLAKEPEKRPDSMAEIEKELIEINEYVLMGTQANLIIDDEAEPQAATLLIEPEKQSKLTKKIAVGIVFVGVVAAISVAIVAGINARNDKGEALQLNIDSGLDVKESDRATAVRNMLKKGTSNYTLNWLWPNAVDSDLKVFEGSKVAKKVDLADLSISDTGLRYFADSPIDRMILDGTSVATLEFIPGRKTMTHLQLKDTKINDDSLANLSGFKNLTELYLDGTNVTADGIRKHLASVPLNELRLSDCPNITASDIEALRHEFPMCHVLPYGDGKNVIDEQAMACLLFIGKKQPHKAIEMWNNWSSFADTHPDPRKRIKIRALGGLAYCYDSMRNHDQAKKLVDEALALATRYGTNYEIRDAYNALYQHYFGMKNWKEALEAGTKTLEYGKKAHGHSEMDLTMQLGTMLMNMQRPEEAIKMFDESLVSRNEWKENFDSDSKKVTDASGQPSAQNLQIARDIRNSLGVTLVQYANCLRGLARFNEAAKKAEEAVAVLQELPDPNATDIVGHAYVSLAASQSNLGDFQAALISNGHAVRFYKQSKLPGIKYHVINALQQKSQIEAVIRGRGGAIPQPEKSGKPESGTPD